MYVYFLRMFQINRGRCFTNTFFSQPLSWIEGNRQTPTVFNKLVSARPVKHLRSIQQRSWTHQALHRCISSSAGRRSLPSAFPIIDGACQPIHRHVIEANLQNSQACQQRYLALMEKVLKGGGENATARHTQMQSKVLVRDRLHMLLDDDEYLELSPFAGMGLPYGDIPSAGCLTGIGKINGLWCVFFANDATVKAGSAYPITVTKNVRTQEIAIQNRLPCVYLADCSGAFLPLQAGIFPDKNHAGRIYYNQAVMSALKIPQVGVVCGHCAAGGAYNPVMTEELVMVNRIGTLFLAGPPLVKAATGEEVTPEELGGARLHSEGSGCVDHFAAVEREAYECTRNVISTLNFKLPEEDSAEIEEPLYNAEELMGLAPKSYNFSMDVKLIVSRLIDGSRFQEFKAYYGTTLVTGFAKIEGHLVGIIASNGELKYEACLKGSHFVQLCEHRDIPLIFLQNTAPEPLHTLSQDKAESNTKLLKAQGSMMSAVACASTPKITVVIGGCHGGDSFAMCGRAFDPNFLFLWPNARVSILAPGHAGGLVQDEEEAMHINERLEVESSAFFSSGRLWDDGVILPQDTRKVLGKCLKIITQKEYQLSQEKQKSPILRL
ncbi:methylcrotonoyl-CoA carboxylase beta chain, mitochondrial isoform X3 [Pangasianodon hypophthalmus]|uniref:methylcrotonoyl-CoA carboxylase beta chain, mitochondrial isoform X3 n=1 Tax=Pangasianodon hypophthalmus TaxID=310915 RepID=UPI002308357D|nr:methylcrotonoyl-CoA carboxylase beta chain, mitochondrial isoform X3 [Pangasianodon hypophthalmus]XP_053092035.1 methylcrotonoyl-CoA carboxylase beta chain, mitochondrial isoform X3 [Pangasianodon hypophthalmus]